MSATTAVERVDFESTPHKIDFKTASNPSLDTLIASLADQKSVAGSDSENPVNQLFDLGKDEKQAVVEENKIETVSRCKGIFELTDDQLRYCVAAPGKPRPTEFSAPKGSGHTLVTLKPVKVYLEDSLITEFK